jgi:hypothetical protein
MEFYDFPKQRDSREKGRGGEVFFSFRRSELGSYLDHFVAVPPHVVLLFTADASE